MTLHLDFTRNTAVKSQCSFIFVILIIMRSHQNGSSSVFIFLIAIALIALGLVTLQVLKKVTTRSDTTISAPVSETSIDCGSDRQCFYQAFSSDCAQKMIKITQNTIEGDSIVTTAKLAQGFEGCIVEATIDGSQDKFGDGKVHTYTCEKLTQEDQKLTANECTGTSQSTSVVI